MGMTELGCSTAILIVDILQIECIVVDMHAGRNPEGGEGREKTGEGALTARRKEQTTCGSF